MAITITTTEYKKLRFEVASGTDPATGLPVLKAKCFRGKSQKPLWYYSFENQARLDRQIGNQKATENVIEGHEIRRAADKADGLAKMNEAIQVGTVLAYSWGFEQTNVDFYQVTERKGKTVVAVPISCEIKGCDGGSSMSGYATPLPGEFIQGEPSIKKVIGAFGLSMKHGSASPVEPTAKHYVSWYA